MSNVELAVQFFLQIAVILLACRLVGLVAARLGQPQVIAEMITGVCLGPSLLGLYFPKLQEALFPWDQGSRDSQSYLFPVAQLGLALYMFIVGMEFRFDIVRSHWKSAVAVSLAGMICPFLLGLALGWYFFHYTKLFPDGSGLFESSLFLGASMCITAFPMLARIVHHKRLTDTRIGSVSIGAGAFGDAAAWCLLAVVLSMIEKDATAAMLNIGGGTIFVLVSMLILRPIVDRFRHALISHQQLTDVGLAMCLVVVSLAAFVTDAIGLHAVFGAFIIGAIIPRGIITRDAIAKIQPLTVALLVPLFFTFSGLNTRLGLLNSIDNLSLCAAVLLVAVAGKGLACWLAARATGIPNGEAMGIGILMNARGMMELIIINIGRERGLISDELFAMLVIMAIVTTLMTSPMLDWCVGSQKTVSSKSLIDDRPQTE